MRGLLRAIAGLTLLTLGCSREGPRDMRDATVPDSRGAEQRLKELKARFPAALTDAWAGLERGGARDLPTALPRTPRGATVRLPARASTAFEVRDDASGVMLRFSLEGARPVPLASARGLVVYARASATGADVLARVTPEGVEDLVVFEQAPPREELRYRLEVGAVAGLRLVSNTLEVVDAAGTPRLRVAPPYVLEADGVPHRATLALEGCAYDRDPAPPFGRSPTPPRAATCVLRVSWRGVRYPLLVDPAWTTTGAMAEGRFQHSVSPLPSGQVLVAGGFGGAGSGWSLASAELYDPASGRFAATGSMPTTRFRHTATGLLDGRVLITGGFVMNSGEIAKAELYDPVTGLFTPTATELSVPRSSHTATLLSSGKVLVTGTGTPSAELFDPVARSFSPTGPLSAGRFAHTATLLADGQVLVAGGRLSGGTPLASAELYRPALGSFAPTTGPMGAPRSGGTATLLGSGKVLITGESGPDAELFDPTTGTFSLTGPMAGERQGHSATLLMSGRVLIVGGVDAAGSLGTELYDPATGAFSAAGDLAIGRHLQGATLLPATGAVLVVGGSGRFGEVLASAERYAIVSAGGECQIGAECASGVCQDGVCCQGPCAGVCKTCAPTTGACVPVSGAVDPDSCSGKYRCDAMGACKLGEGQPCPGGAGACASGFCADGYCCSTPCAGACDTCASPTGPPGTCSVLPAGQAPSGACSYRCNGLTPGCPTSCAVDDDCYGFDCPTPAPGMEAEPCTPNLFCAADRTCRSIKPRGSPCDPSDCLAPGCAQCGPTGTCTEGVCCSSPCGSLCSSCLAALKGDGTPDGVCGPVRDNTNPRGAACPVDPATTCARNGLCDGGGRCRLYYPAGSSCGGSACQGTLVVGQVCDGSGGCHATPAGLDCAPYLCAGGACTTTCSTSDDCAASGWCDLGQCRPRRGQGERCSLPEACSSRTCVDGYCCDGPCTGQCEACDVGGAEGTCAPVMGTPHGGRPACRASDSAAPCEARRCDGAERATCVAFVGSNVPCGTPTCTDRAAVEAGRCDGRGGCLLPAATPCGPYACAPSACRSSCAQPSDCAPGHTCDLETGQCVQGATCDGAHHVTGANGAVTDCAPYRCALDGTCRTTCDSVDDCVSGTLCDRSHACVRPQGAQGGGCTVGASTRAVPPAAPLLLWALIALSWRRRTPTRPRPGAPRAP